MELPDLGLVTMRDAETGEQIVRRHARPRLPQALRRVAERRETGLREALAQAGVDTLELATDDDLLERMLRFADLRKQRSRARQRSGAAHAGAPARCMNAATEGTQGHAMKFLWPETAVGCWRCCRCWCCFMSGCCSGARRPRCATPALGLVKQALGTGQRLAPPRAADPAAAWRSPRCCSPLRGRLAVDQAAVAAQTIVLAMDVSGSMRATDVQPNRLVASQDAAKAFVAELPRNVRVAVVASPARPPWCRRRR